MKPHTRQLVASFGWRRVGCDAASLWASRHTASLFAWWLRHNADRVNRSE